MRSSRVCAAALLAALVFLSCQWDLGQAVCHPSVEQRVRESLDMPAPSAVTVSPDSFSFAMFGDPQIHDNLVHRLDRFREDVAARNISFFCVLGDLTHDATDEEVRVIRQAMDSVGVRWYATVGNHDLYQSDGWTKYRQNFGPATYSVTIADRVKLIFIDTASGVIGPTQFDWLEDQLADAEGMFSLVGTHFPCYDGIAPVMWRMASTAERHKLQYLLREYGAWAYVSGHIHGWRHTEVEGVNHFICGTMAPGGLDYGEPGYLLITFAHDSLAWQKVDF